MCVHSVYEGVGLLEPCVYYSHTGNSNRIISRYSSRGIPTKLLFQHGRTIFIWNTQQQTIIENTEIIISLKTLHASVLMITASQLPVTAQRIFSKSRETNIILNGQFSNRWKQLIA